jgi:hypothetical protein
MRVEIKAFDGSEIYSGDIEDMPDHGDFVDIYEEAVNMGIESGQSLNGWTWEVA